MPRDDWCFGLPSNSKNRLQDLGAAYSSIQRCSRTDAHKIFDRLQDSTAHVEPLVTLRCSWFPFKPSARRTGAPFCSSWASTTNVAAAFRGRACCGLSVILTDADLAMTAAIASCWPGTLHLHSLWHVFKNVLKNCSSSFANNDDKTDMMRCFRNAAFAAPPEVRWQSLVRCRHTTPPREWIGLPHQFAPPQRAVNITFDVSCVYHCIRWQVFGTQVARLEQLVAGKKCKGYIADLIKNKTKWAFCCRPTVLTLGMVATQRTEGLFGVAKRLGVEKKLSLCAL
ncbi:unnamed protein product [Ectocarpus sp. CCAP 1310/34]|nr:unnamed protein product [Ectocarpus sp. CCAP 1310/34]